MTETIIPLENDKLVNTFGSGDQEDVKIASLADGGYVMSWKTENRDGSGNSVAAQIYNADGTPKGGEFMVNTTTANNQSAPKITGLEDGSFVVVWNSFLQDGSGNTVITRIFDADGTPVGPEIQVNQETEGNQFVAGIDARPDGGFVVTWHSQEQDGSGYGVFARIFDAAGAATGDEFQVNTSTESDQRAQDVVVNEDGSFLVLWTSPNQLTPGADLFGQLYAADGSEVGEEILFNDETDLRRTGPRATATEDGGYLVVWREYSLSGTAGGIFSRKINADGSIGDVVFVSAPERSISDPPEILQLADGTFFLTWHAWRADEDENGIVGQRLDSNGVPIEDRILINTRTQWNQLEPDLVQLENGDLVIAWTSDTPGGFGGLDYGIYARQFNVLALGTEASDVYRGTYGDDLFHGLDGDDTLLGGHGDDVLRGGLGNDILDGGDGEDRLWGGDGNDRIDGGSGNDEIYGDDGDDNLRGESGDDEIEGGDGDDELSGSWGDDRLYGDEGHDLLKGGHGSDQLEGGDGNDTLKGDDGDDYLWGQSGNDFIDGGGGNDEAYGGVGDDTLKGREGNDALYGEWGDDTLSGGWGDDRLYGDLGEDSLHGGQGEDRLYGGANNDRLYGDDGADLLRGESGDDWLDGGGGNDELHGDDGNDTLRGRGGDDILYGGQMNDTLLGGWGDDQLFGGTQDDELKGYKGNDILNGGSGDDILEGGSGADTFVFASGDGNDTISDFEDSVDLIEFLDPGLAFADLTITDGVDGHAYIDYGSGDQIVVIGQAGLIDETDFVFNVV